ncbi:hypothetical protein EXIGLDRAFT_719143 [Exidia glandulosa HHB12029]|uniref:Uncharacterized protein n=1 Tax=Exidia glandulosa HHB12029 TaxID=1314781 RepID=A0A166AGE6_EXIGL|nr:hypothetical protein EXIGLDRAFT_719143 [Exidia glandulosa HHB12029]
MCSEWRARGVKWKVYGSLLRARGLAEQGGLDREEQRENVRNREEEKQAELANGERSNVARSCGGLCDVNKVINGVAQALRAR